MMTAKSVSTTLTASLLIAGAAFASEPIRTLLITGQNNHNWQYTSRVHAETLEATGRFDVDITEDPESVLKDAAQVAKYKLFVIDYNDNKNKKRMGEQAEKNFEKAVAGGSGVVAIHASNNAFPGWIEFEKMIGLMWREGASHGKFHAFDIDWVDAQHPVTQGVAAFKAQPDELYHGLSNPQNVKTSLLAQAMSSKESGGTGKNEPMAYTVNYGTGKIFVTTLGHVWANDEKSKVSVHTPGFKILVARGSEWAATGAVTIPATWSDVRKHNQLTAEEKAAGWKLLFDGEKAIGFRGFKKAAMPEKGWVIKDGMLTHVTQGAGGDLASIEQYGDFEFSCEWRVASGGNSGVMYRCSEEYTYPWETGPEMQILDDANHRDGKSPKTRSGTLYDLVERSADVSRPAGEWNTAVARVKGTRIVHELNGVVVVDIDTSSKEFAELYKASKWPGMPHYNTKTKGHICLQDHGDEVSFRNIKVRELKD